MKLTNECSLASIIKRIIPEPRDLPKTLDDLRLRWFARPIGEGDPATYFIDGVPYSLDSAMKRRFR